MNKAQATFLTGTVWVAALTSAAAFAFAMNRPLTVAPPPTEPAPLRLVHVDPIEHAAEPAEPLLIVLPTLEIVGQVARPIPKAAPAPKVRDISDMKCTPFKPLEQGGGGVQVCE
jgi:hypothetical protein